MSKYIIGFFAGLSAALLSWAAAGWWRNRKNGGK